MVFACVDAPLGSLRYWLVGRGLNPTCQPTERGTKDLCEEGKANHCSGKRFQMRQAEAIYVGARLQTVANTSDQRCISPHPLVLIQTSYCAALLGWLVFNVDGFGCRVSATTSISNASLFGVVGTGTPSHLYTADEV